MALGMKASEYRRIDGSLGAGSTASASRVVMGWRGTSIPPGRQVTRASMAEHGCAEKSECKTQSLADVRPASKAGISLQSLDEMWNPLHHRRMMQRMPAERLSLVGYGVVAGVGAIAFGDWASSPVSGSARFGTWLAVTGVSALALGWCAERVLLLVWRLSAGTGRSSLSQ